jgi:hypothetical protein
VVFREECLERRQDLADIIKKIEEASKKFNEEHEWKPRTINGVDCGEWVSKKDGRSLGNLGYEVGLD